MVLFDLDKNRSLNCLVQEINSVKLGVKDKKEIIIRCLTIRERHNIIALKGAWPRQDKATAS